MHGGILGPRPPAPPSGLGEKPLWAQLSPPRRRLPRPGRPSGFSDAGSRAEGVGQGFPRRLTEWGWGVAVGEGHPQAKRVQQVGLPHLSAPANPHLRIGACRLAWIRSSSLKPRAAAH